VLSTVSIVELEQTWHFYGTLDDVLWHSAETVVSLPLLINGVGGDYELWQTEMS